MFRLCHKWRNFLQVQNWKHISDLGARCISTTGCSRLEGEDVNLIRGVQQDLPRHASVVICGAGVVGTSVAYHLAERGWKDIIVLEMGSIGGGSTWHAAGLLGQVKASSVESSLSEYSIKLYKKLEAEGYTTGFKECGSLHVARTNDRLVLLKRFKARSDTRGVKTEIVSPEKAKELCPIIKEDDLMGGLWVPDDGVGNPLEITKTLARAAMDKGVRIFERCKVDDLVSSDNRITEVVTPLGSISCDYFINCAGQWSRVIGKKSTPQVKVPVHSCQVSYLVTHPFADVDPNMPVVRDYDGYVFFREWGGGILAGGYEPVGKPLFHDGIPDNFEFQLLPEDWDSFQVLLEQILHRVPSLGNSEVRQLVNAAEGFTPDCKCIVGKTPEFVNYYVATGMNSMAISAAGGVGRLLAQWMDEGEPVIDVWSIDVRRFVDLHNNRKFLRDRVRETIGFISAIPYPRSEIKSVRKLRTSPLYTRLHSNGGMFGEKNGFERAMWFEDDREIQETDYSTSLEFYDEVSSIRGDFYKPDWFDNVEREYWCCREGVCLIDMSSFSKFEIKSAGREVVDFLQYVCSNDIDKPVGAVVHTGIQNKNGGYENDCSLVRMDDHTFFMISPTSQQTRGFHWLSEHLPKDRSVLLSDVTSMYTALNIMGPKAQELLSELTDTSMKKTDFQSMTCKTINLGNASGIKAMRLTHTGEDGWVLYIPSEYALHVYDTLMHRGRDYGIRNAGYYALRSLRIEKFFAYWGLDLNSLCTPFEVGRDFRVKFDKGDFIGRDALLKQKEEGIKKKFVHFTVESHDVNNDPWTFGGEPIYRNGQFVGFTTSSCFGYTMNRLICLGIVANIQPDGSRAFIKNDFFLNKNAEFEIEVAGKRFPAKPSIYPPKFSAVSNAHGYMPKKVKYKE